MKGTIIRFDHISHVFSRKHYKVRDDYKFCELNITNTTGRYRFMDGNYKDIDMYYYDQDFPVEVVLYDNVENRSDVWLEDNVICCKGQINMIDEIEGVFSRIGFHKEDNLIWKIKGTLDRRNAFIRIVPQKEVITIPINWGGYNCPCFMIKSVKVLFEKLSNIDYVQVSEINELLVNNKIIDVGFLGIRGFQLAFEFISPHR